MTKTIKDFVAIQEVNRIVQGLSKTSGKPADHVQSVWDETSKEVIHKHEHGVVDSYKKIGNIVKAKLGMKPEDEEEK